jgi:hypothetical protein
MFRISVAALVLLSAVSLAAANGPRLLESTDSEILIELATDDYSLEEVSFGGESFVRVTAPGLSRTTEEGLPSLPMETVLVGVPFGSRLSLDVVTLESENLGAVRAEPVPRERILWDESVEMATPVSEFFLDEEFYRSGGAYPPRVAELSEQSTLRHQRVVRVVFHPFQYSPGSGALTVHRRIGVRISFQSEGRSENLTRAVAIEPEWDRTYTRTIINHEQAAAWRMRPRPRHLDSRADRARDEEHYRVLTLEPGIHRLDFAELEAEGLAGSIPTAEVALYQRSFDDALPDPFVETPVPLTIVDADENGYFDSADYVLFQAQSFEQQRMPIGYEDRYGNENAYWFTQSADLALRMVTRPGWLDEPGLVAPSSFRDTVRFEEDVYLHKTPDDDYLDLYHWTDYQENGDNYALPFEIHDIDAAGEIRMRARYQGIALGTHNIDFEIENSLGSNAFGEYTFYGISESMNEDFYLSGSIPASYFVDGANVLRAIGAFGRSGANLDWFEFRYDRDFASVDGRLQFTNAGETGLSEFSVGGIASDNLRLFDTTGPFGTAELSLDAAMLTGPAGDHTLTFQDEVSGFTRYEVVEHGSYLRVVDIELRADANLRSAEGDLIVISYDDFAAGVEPLLTHREAEGWIVSRALASEVYDEFGSGLKSLEAIKDYLDYAFDEWSRTPQFVLLVGDGSSDTKGLSDSSEPDFIPTLLGHGGGDYPYMTASDLWFVRAEDGDELPRMFIGRLPVEGSSQLNTVVSKILAYEDYSAADEWRNNAYFIADDQWKYATFGGAYFWDLNERDFHDVCVGIADTTVAASPAGIDTTIFSLSRYTTPFHESNGVSPGSQPSEYFFDVYWFVDAEVTPVLISELNDGAALVNFQGHGSRTQMTHEVLLQAPYSPELNDINDLDNEGKPFIFMGFSCNLAQFHHPNEGLSTNVESIVEQMLFLPSGRGAVAGFACSGAAYRTENLFFNEDIFNAFFATPTPAGPPEDYFWPRWTLGSIFGEGIVRFLGSGGSDLRIRNYVLLGDPLMHVEMSPPAIQVTMDGVPLVSGEYLEASDGQVVTLVADIIDEVEVDPASIVVEDTGATPVVVPPEEYTIAAVGDTLGELGRWYRLTYQTEIRGGFPYDIRISATDANGRTATFVAHVAEGDRILIRDVANHPNPFASTTRIIYLLNQSGADVDISIYTVGGRLIRRIEGASNDLNYNEVVWDGVDQDGDTVANGLYLYVIEAKGDDGTSATSPVGRMVKAK